MNKNILFFIIFAICFQKVAHGMEQIDPILSLQRPYKEQNTIILNTLPLKIWGRIFTFIWQESFKEGEYHFCRYIRNLLITCKQFYYDKELLELIVAKNVALLNSTYGVNTESVFFVPTTLYLNTQLSRCYFKELSKHPHNLQRAQEVLKSCYSELAAMNDELSESEEKTKSVTHYKNLIRQIENCGVSLHPEF